MHHRMYYLDLSILVRHHVFPIIHRTRNDKIRSDGQYIIIVTRTGEPITWRYEARYIRETADQRAIRSTAYMTFLRTGLESALLNDCTEHT